jgi:diguanylate cyclase (GGDEF)-like protein/PAS domain S-box-containing protein
LIDALLLAALAGAAVYAAMLFSFRKFLREKAQLEKSTERFRALTGLSADWFWETDAEHRVVWLSGGGPVATFFGRTSTYGKRFWEIPGVEIEPRALAIHLERLAAEQAFFDLEISRRDERGARQVHIVSGQSRYDDEGRFAGYRGVGHDVTEQRSAERKLVQAKERLELALDGGNLAEWHFDVTTGELFVGDGWVRFLGLEDSPDVTHGADLLPLLHPDDRAPYREALVRALKGDAPLLAEFRIRAQNGEWKWLQGRGRVTERGADGRALRMSGTVADIETTKRTQARLLGSEAALRAEEQRFRQVAEASGEYLWETDADWRYTYLSERAEALLGHRRSEMLGRTPADFAPLGERAGVERDLKAVAAAKREFRDLVGAAVTRSGGLVWQSLNGVPVVDAAGRLTGYRGTAADVTGRKQDEARIEFLSTRDALTGLPNRVLLADRGRRAILTAARARSQLALLCFDLDRFKLVNDSLDHRVGDALLRAVAERLESLVGEDALARVGGDEFVLLAPVRSPEEAAVPAQRILDALARPFSVEGRTLNVAASIGISVYPGDGADFGELLRNADAAMFHAKESGRGTFRFFSPPLNARAVERLRLENDLRGALTRGELMLHWHPVMRGRPGQGGEVVGAEALVRWNHPERGLLMPEDFVPLAEECGLIRSVGEWTLEHALSQAGAWQRRLPGRAWFAVNVSASELALGDAYVERLRRGLAAHGLPGSCIELEITERVLMSGLAANIETLKRIGALGVRFSVDDFGTGYSSLAYLRLLPIQKLKIDRSFLRELDTHAADEAIVRAIAALANALGIAVAAEGVEREVQLERLMALGCDLWQGHYFSAPVDAAAFETMLASDRQSLRTARTSDG